MNKKILFIVLFLLIGVFPIIALAANDVAPIVTRIKNMFVSIGTAIVIIGWIIAGILYLTAAGNPEKIGIAKKALVAAVIGTALIVLSVTAEDVLEFYLDPGR